MKRKTNLFYTTGPDSKFLTFSNYTEALTGNFLSTDTKLYPTTFLCLQIDDITNIETREKFIKEYLTAYYENKLAFLRDYCIEHNYIAEQYINPLAYLLDTIIKFISDNDPDKTYPEIQKNLIRYIGDVTEQDYNGTYTDTICIVNFSSYYRGLISVHNTDNFPIYPVDEKEAKYLYGWKNIIMPFNDTKTTDQIEYPDNTNKEDFQNKYPEYKFNETSGEVCEMYISGTQGEIYLNVNYDISEEDEDFYLKNLNDNESNIIRKYSIEQSGIINIYENNGKLSAEKLYYDAYLRGENAAKTDIKELGIVNIDYKYYSDNDSLNLIEYTGDTENLDTEKLNEFINKVNNKMINCYCSGYNDYILKFYKSNYEDPDYDLTTANIFTLYNGVNPKYDNLVSDVNSDNIILADKSGYYFNSLVKDIKISMEGVDSNNDVIKFNVVIPLFDVTNINYTAPNNISDNIITKSAGDTFISFEDENDINEEYIPGAKYVPLGIWFSDDDIVLKKDIVTGFSQSWSLLISSQFKPFPYSHKMSNIIDDTTVANAFPTFAMVLSRQNTILDEFSKLSAIINEQRKEIQNLQLQLNSKATELNIDKIKREFINFEYEMTDKYNKLEQKVKKYMENIQWNTSV